MSEQNSASEMAAKTLETSWNTTANQEAVKLGAETGKQEGLSARLGRLNERLKQIDPSSKVAEKSMKFLEKQAKKQEKMAAKAERKQTKADTKGQRLLDASDKQIAKVDTLQAKVGGRITSAEQTENMKQLAAREGLNVNVKDKSNWFDRNVVDKVDKMRVGWNEKLANWNAGRAEKQLQKARGYQVSAEGLRKAADLLRNQIKVGIATEYSAKTADAQVDLQNKQGNFAGALEDSSRDAADAAARLESARTELPQQGKDAADQIRQGADIGDVSKQYFENANATLDNAANSKVQ